MASLPPPEIESRLRARFGDDIGDFTDQYGHAVATIPASRYRDVVMFLRDEPALACDYCDFTSAVDWGPDGGFEVITHLHSNTHHHNVRLKVECGAEDPHCPTLTEIWSGANWAEREAWELFGIVFDGHPHLVKLVLPEQFEGHPLRKDFALMTREAKPWPGAVPEGEEIEE